MNKIWWVLGLLGLLALLVFLSFLSGCLSRGNNEFEINRDGLKIEIQESAYPLSLKISGNNNLVTILEGVNVSDINFGTGSNWGSNNTVVCPSSYAGVGSFLNNNKIMYAQED